MVVTRDSLPEGGEPSTANAIAEARLAASEAESDQQAQVAPWLRGLFAMLILGGVGLIALFALNLLAARRTDGSLIQLGAVADRIGAFLVLELTMLVGWFFVWLLVSSGGRRTLRSTRQEPVKGRAIGMLAVVLALVGYGSYWEVTRVDQIELLPGHQAVLRNLLGLRLGSGPCQVSVRRHDFARKFGSTRPSSFKIDLACASGSHSSFPIMDEDLQRATALLRDASPAPPPIE